MIRCLVLKLPVVVDGGVGAAAANIYIKSARYFSQNIYISRKQIWLCRDSDVYVVSLPVAPDLVIYN